MVGKSPAEGIERVPSSRGLTPDEILGKTVATDTQKLTAAEITAKATTGLAANDKGRVDPELLKQYMISLVRDSKLNGVVPNDAKDYGIDGSPESWGRYFQVVCERESDFKTKEVGDIGRFRGNSNGLFQLSPDDGPNYGISKAPYTLAQLQDPELNCQITVKIHEILIKKYHAIKAGAGRYWSTARKPTV